MELVILDAVLDVAGLPCPKSMTAKQKEGYKYCKELAVKLVRPFATLLQKRKIDNDKPHKIKKSKRRRAKKAN